MLGELEVLINEVRQREVRRKGLGLMKGNCQVIGVWNNGWVVKNAGVIKVCLAVRLFLCFLLFIVTAVAFLIIFEGFLDRWLLPPFLPFLNDPVHDIPESVVYDNIHVRVRKELVCGRLNLLEHFRGVVFNWFWNQSLVDRYRDLRGWVWWIMVRLISLRLRDECYRLEIIWN